MNSLLENCFFSCHSSALVPLSVVRMTVRRNAKQRNALRFRVPALSEYHLHQCHSYQPLSVNLQNFSWLVFCTNAAVLPTGLPDVKSSDEKIGSTETNCYCFSDRFV